MVKVPFFIFFPFRFFFFTVPNPSHYNDAWRLAMSGVLFVCLPIIGMSISIDRYSFAIFPHTFLSFGIDLTCIHHNIFLLLFFCVTFPQLSSSPLVFLHQAGMWWWHWLCFFLSPFCTNRRRRSWSMPFLRSLNRVFSLKRPKLTNFRGS